MTTPQHPQDEIRQEIYDAIHVGFFVDDADDLAVDVCNDTTEAVLAALSAAGYRIIQTEAAEHGDALVPVGYHCEGLGHEHPKFSRHDSDEMVTHVSRSLSFDGRCKSATPAFVLRRVVGNEQDTQR